MRFVPGGAARFADAKTVLVACLLAIGGAGGLAGCTGDPAPIVTEAPTVAPSPTETSSPSPSPSATALTDEELLALMPEEAARDDLFGAMATAQFYAELLGTIWSGEGADAWIGLATENCGYCASQTDNLRALWAEGATARGGTVHVDESLTRAALAEDGAVVVELTAAVDELLRVDRDGQSTVANPAVSTEIIITLVRPGGVWLVDGVHTESTER
ncbi:hypothetical protein Lsed01_01301 [Demequina sediminis]|uniref:SnoaL-like domain-containing protein n=1 Tax=Demequina sediminis TaxID=1930058 RepID=A0ABP9WGC4_9MICO|nr:hypothetical protein [Demequina sediminis]BDZ61500.1 hypothetical protein GCM10025873_12910 [Demequina sediminis]